MMDTHHTVRRAVHNHNEVDFCLNCCLPCKEVVGLILDWFREFQNFPFMVS
jgi:hypothetical protein